MNIRLSDGVLRCPKCDETYLHHEDVEVYPRRLEDGPSGAIVVTGGRAIAGHPERNPSARRDGIVIAFRCEVCGDFEEGGKPKRLAIWQHKGETFVEWLDA